MVNCVLEITQDTFDNKPMCGSKIVHMLTQLVDNNGNVVGMCQCVVLQ